MPITMDIVEDGRVFYLVLSDPWDGQDLDPVFAQVRRYLDEVDHKVHTLANMNATRMTPSMPRIRDTVVLAHQNSGVFAVVGASRITRMLAEMVFSFFHFTAYAFFETEEDAWQYIREAICKEDGGDADAGK